MTGAAGGVPVSVEQRVDGALAAQLHALYRASFGHLESRAAARHVLAEAEFMQEMADRRISKYVAWDPHGEPVGLCTLTKSLTAVPWISPAYYEQRYPEHHARNAIYYLGLALVHPRLQGQHALRDMAAQFVHVLVQERAVLAWDVCAYNEARHLNRLFASMLHSLAGVTVEEIDRQLYFGCAFHPAPGADR